MSENRPQTRPKKTKVNHVRVDVPKSVWELVGELSEYYGVGKVDVIKMLVYAEASRLGLTVRR